MKNLSLIEIMMSVMILAFGISTFTGCGYASRDNEMTGQVKKVINQTPLLCFDRTDVDISLGVMQNGVGSMSHEDIIGTAYDPEVIKTLKIASESGKLVKVVTQHARLRWCASELEITKVEILGK